jgi:hypothetical protein
LTTLSHDAVPKLVEFFNDPEIPEDIRNEIGSVLACKSAMNEEQKEYTWVAYNTSRQQALALLESLENALEKFPVSYDMYTWFVEVNGEVRSCTGYGPEIYD